MILTEDTYSGSSGTCGEQGGTPEIQRVMRNLWSSIHFPQASGVCLNFCGRLLAETAIPPISDHHYGRMMG